MGFRKFWNQGTTSCTSDPVNPRAGSHSCSHSCVPRRDLDPGTSILTPPCGLIKASSLSAQDNPDSLTSSATVSSGHGVISAASCSKAWRGTRGTSFSAYPSQKVPDATESMGCPLECTFTLRRVVAVIPNVIDNATFWPAPYLDS